MRLSKKGWGEAFRSAASFGGITAGATAASVQWPALATPAVLSRPSMRQVTSLGESPQPTSKVSMPSARGSACF